MKDWIVHHKIISAIAIIAVIGIAAAAGGSGSKAAHTKSSASAAVSCGNHATDSCTPHEPATGSVKVDALVWTLSSAYQAHQVPLTNEIAPAGDTFVVALLRSRSTKTQSATLTTDVVKLKIGPNTYTQDSMALLAWPDVSGKAVVVSQDIQAGETLSIAVIFRVPSSQVAKHPELQFNELGFGSTQGYIALAQPLRH